MLRHTISPGEDSRIGGRELGQAAQSDVYSDIGKPMEYSNWWINESHQPVYRSDTRSRAVFYRPVSLNQVFVFFNQA